MEIKAENTGDIASAYSLYYSRLADVFCRLIKRQSPRLILEGGCGKGQLTFPLLERLPRQTKLIGIDSSAGPYSGWLAELREQSGKLGFADRINLVEADVRKMTTIRTESIDAIVSNELLCDLPQERELAKALGEFHRVLRPGGLMVHGEWSSVPENRAKSFILKHWPTWNPDQLFLLTKREGFVEFQTTYFETTIRFSYTAAMEEVRTWGGSPRLISKNARRIREYGIQLPFEHIVRCRKPISG